MVFIDANVVYHKDHPEVTLATALAAFECGFDAVVLNYICTGRPDKSDKGIPDTFVEAIHRAISDRSTAAGARAAALRVLNPARPPAPRVQAADDGHRGEVPGAGPGAAGDVPDQGL